LQFDPKGYTQARKREQSAARREAQQKIRRLQRSYLANPYWRHSKRGFDLAVSSMVILFVLSWMYPLLFVLIKLESSGPIIFKQKRNGLDLKPFWCLKFRSMRLNEDADTLPVQHGDTRITRVGHFIRKYSIDELPQFINVLKGEMSVVGPRPHMLSETNQFNKVSADFYKRHEVKPGITGLAQIRDCRGEISSKYDLTDRLKYDLFYIRKASFGYDFMIVYKTFVKMLLGDPKAK
jgi:putative colanic acid biosynthesis UDP-glucose lipid carrier transferase